MKSYEEKTVSGHVADIDDASRRVKVVMNEMGSLDLDQDVIDKTAFNKTIKERGPKGASLIWHLTDHVPMLKSAVGKPSEVLAQNNQLIFVTNIPGTTWGNDVLEFYKTGAINQHSIGFRVIKAEPMKAGTPQEYRLIKEVLLYEGSAVLWGANPNTDTLSVGKNFNPGDLEKKYLQTAEEINTLAEALRVGKFTDDTAELVNIRLIQAVERLKLLNVQPHKSTSPVKHTVKPVGSAVKVIDDFIKSF